MYPAAKDTYLFEQTFRPTPEDFQNPVSGWVECRAKACSQGHFSTIDRQYT